MAIFRDKRLRSDEVLSALCAVRTGEWCAARDARPATAVPPKAISPEKQRRTWLALPLLLCGIMTLAPIALSQGSLNAPNSRIIQQSPQRSESPRDINSESDDSGPRWPPTNVDQFRPVATADTPCPLKEVLQGASQHAEELTKNLERFSAIERVEDIAFGKNGKGGSPTNSTFNYIVLISQPRPGLVSLTEMREGNKLSPNSIAENNLAASALIFHPLHMNEFSMVCEGLGSWRGQPSWRVHFAQLSDMPARFQGFQVGTRMFPVRLKGRAWIRADSYQVEHLEEDLLDPIPQAGLATEHIATDYRPVAFPSRKIELWLPERVDLYLDYRAHRVYQSHQLSDFLLFSVDVKENLALPNPSK